MSVFQTALSSARFSRFLMWGSGIVLFVGVVVLLMSLVKGNDTTQVNPDKGFHPQLPAKSSPLQNAQGVTITKYNELDPDVRSTIRTFLATAVARKHLDASWAVIAPSMRKGYTFKSWSHAKALPVDPVSDRGRRLDAVLPRLRLDARRSCSRSASRRHAAAKMRPTAFQLGLVPVSAGKDKKVWRVNYWMPRWTPPLPTN